MTFSKIDNHTDPLFKQLHILKFTDLITLYIATFMYKFHHKLLPVAFDNYFQLISSKHQYNTRLASIWSYCINHVRTNYGKFGFRCKGAVA